MLLIGQLDMICEVILLNNCVDSPCKYRLDDCDNDYCVLHQSEIPDNVDEVGCKDFMLARTCLECKYSLTSIYETGTIDDIEYRCPFQDNKMIYDDTKPSVDHHNDIPECTCGKFELAGVGS